MALVTSLEPNPKLKQSVHGPTRCLYAIIETADGSQFLQLDTVGSDDRAYPNKPSQTIQFDRQAAGQLLQRTFPGLVGTEPSQPGGEPTTGDGTEGDAVEGRTLFRMHRLRERDPGLARRKKRTVQVATGRLACEVCGFDFVAVYGSLGEGFAECHHRVPLAELSGEAPTRLKDLAIVCANCHRMLHRRRTVMSVEALREHVTHHRPSPPPVGGVS